MDKLMWVIPIALVVTLIVYFNKSRRKKFTQLCIQLFEIAPEGKFTDEQTELVAQKLLNYHRELRLHSRKHYQLFSQFSIQKRGGKLALQSLQEAEVEMRKAGITYYIALRVAHYWGPKGFVVAFQQYLAHNIAQEEGMVIIVDVKR